MQSAICQRRPTVAISTRECSHEDKVKPRNKSIDMIPQSSTSCPALLDYLILAGREDLALDYRTTKKIVQARDIEPRA